MIPAMPFIKGRALTMQLSRELLRWFESHSQKIIKKCRRTVTSVPGLYDHEATVYVPGGDDKYPAFWIRDAVMQCRSGFVSREEMERMLNITLFYQNGPQLRELENGLRVLPWAIADHIILPGLGIKEFQETHPVGAVFYPGSYSSGNNQGTGDYGNRPADDDIYEAIELTRLIIEQCPEGDVAGFLNRIVAGESVIDRLHNGFQAMPVDENSGLCRNRPEDWSASNFHDALRPMGLIALTSVLRFRAAVTMERFYCLLENKTLAEAYDQTAQKIADSVSTRLLQENAWIHLATEVDRQPDVWATAMAVYYGLLSEELCEKTCRAMLEAYQDGLTVNYSGYLRHTLTTADVIPGAQVWEHGTFGGQYGTYQGGGYWPQPLGYYVHALGRVDETAAIKLAETFIRHTRQLEQEGAPFEWINPAIRLPETPGLGRFYGPSAALPLEGFRKTFVG